MKINSNRLKDIIIENALGQTVSVAWVMQMIERAEQEVPNYIEEDKG